MTRSIVPYGDATGDGRVQLSFTLPVEADEQGEAAALALVEQMGVSPALVAHAEQTTPGYTFFVVYGTTCHAVDLDALQLVERDWPLLSHHEVDEAIHRHLGRRMVVLGANIETDAHTVGLDAILNVKGFAGDKGLESYRMFEVHNLGAQVDSEELVAMVGTRVADAVLVSQVVTERDAHKHHLGRFVRLLSEAGLRERTVVVAGGPRLVPSMAGELGLDAVFGRGTSPRDVASFLAHRCAGRSS